MPDDMHKKGGDKSSHEEGVETTKQKHGEDFYQKIGQKGGQSQGQDNNPGNFANRSEEDVEEAGRKGGEAAHPHGRGLQNADEKTREEVARKGGQS